MEGAEKRPRYSAALQGALTLSLRIVTGAARELGALGSCWVDVCKARVFLSVEFRSFSSFKPRYSGCIFTPMYAFVDVSFGCGILNFVTMRVSSACALRLTDPL